MMKIPTRMLFLAAAFSLISSSAQSAVLVDYRVSGSQWNANSVPPDVSASIADTFGSAAPSFSTNSATENWPTGGKSLTDYIGFTVAADPGNFLTLDQLQFVAWQGSGPSSGEMTYSLDGFTTIAGSQTFSLGSNSATALNAPKMFSLGGDITDQVEFRIYFYNASSTTGRLFIRGSSENVSGIPGIFELTGSVAPLPQSEPVPVPEPNSIMVLLGMGLYFLRKKRRFDTIKS